MSSTNTPKLLIIGAGDFQLPLVQEAAKTCQVLLAAPVISEAFEPYISDRLICDVRDEETILAFAKKHQIDGVITDQTDIAVRSVAYVAENMGLPGIGSETGLLFTDKSRMRARMAELGIHQLENRTVASVEEAVEFFRHYGGRVINVDMEERVRTIGVGHYNFRKSLSLWLNSFTAFSVKPLRLATGIGVLWAFLGSLLGLRTIIRKLLNPAIPLGYSSTMAALLFSTGMIMFMLGLIGEYIGRIYISLNNSPQFVIRDTINLDE